MVKVLVVAVGTFAPIKLIYKVPFQIHKDASVPTYKTLEVAGLSVGAVVFGFVPANHEFVVTANLAAFHKLALVKPELLIETPLSITCPDALMLLNLHLLMMELITLM